MSPSISFTLTLPKDQKSRKFKQKEYNCRVRDWWCSYLRNYAEFLSYPGL